MNRLNHSKRLRWIARSALAVVLALPTLGCGLMMRGHQADGLHYGPRPFKQLRAMRREHQLEQELQKETFPSAEQAGVAPSKETSKPRD